MEYEHSRAVQSDVDVEAHREFVVGLQMMSSLLGRHVQNFAWCAGQIVGDPDAPAQILGMVKFAINLKEFGFEMACRAVEENAGVRVSVAVPRSSRNVPGIVVGLVDADFDIEECILDGVAVIENSIRQEAFVKVKIRPNGETYLLSEDQQRDDPETRRLMNDLRLNRK